MIGENYWGNDTNQCKIARLQNRKTYYREVIANTNGKVIKSQKILSPDVYDESSYFCRYLTGVRDGSSGSQ